MSKTAKARSKQKRLAEKRARKQQKQALYEGFRRQGLNSKSKRAKKNNKRNATVMGLDHPSGKCGNIGCTRCHKIYFGPFLKDGKPYRMPHHMWLKWKEKQAA